MKVAESLLRVALCYDRVNEQAMKI